MLDLIFRKAQNKIQDPAKLRRLIVDLIDREQRSSISSDVKGDAYEGLLEKNADDDKCGTGQYVTPRALIAAMMDVMAPQPNQTICDLFEGGAGETIRRALLKQANLHTLLCLPTGIFYAQGVKTNVADHWNLMEHGQPRCR